MKRFAIAMLLAMAGTAAQAEIVGSYTGVLGNSDQLVVNLDDKPSTNPHCRGLTNPREAMSFLRWKAVTEATTAFAGGCWALNEVGKIEVTMWRYSTNEPVDLVLDPKNVVKTGRGAELWPTANAVTMEPAPGYGSKVIASATYDTGMSTVLVQLTDAQAPNCYGNDAKIARVRELNGRRDDTLACWAKGRFEVVLWYNDANQNQWGTVDPNLVIDTTDFQKTADFRGWY